MSKAKMLAAAPPLVIGEPGIPVKCPARPFSDDSHSWTRSAVIPQSITVSGSVISSGICPRAGVGDQRRIAS